MKAQSVAEPTSDPQPIDVTGYITPFTAAGQPCLLHLGDKRTLCMPLFRDVVALEEFLESAPGFTYDRLVQVNDAQRFLAEIPLFVRLVADPVVKDGRMRYAEIWRDE